MGWGDALFSSFASYRMASLTGASNKGVFRILTVTTILLPLTSIIGCIWIVNTFGVTRTSLGSWYVGNWNSRIGSTECGTTPTAPPWIPYAVLGAVVVGVLWFLHSRFLWWPIEPSGYVLATTMHPLLEGLWLPFLVAWVAKTITLRAGGSKAYEEYGVPIATGFLTGTTLSILIGGGIGVYRFFFPF
jgi:hypothetical protein